MGVGNTSKHRKDKPFFVFYEVRIGGGMNSRNTWNDSTLKAQNFVSTLLYGLEERR